MKRQIVNIVNFIRAVEPRMPMDLIQPVREQIALMKKHHLRGTFLLQYDALIRPEYVNLLKELDPAQFEIGVWFEVVQPLVEKAGIEWTGRFPWDWHVHCGFPLGYTRQQREKLIDILYEDFRATFGDYPKVFGSWIFDSHTARYVCDRYGADAMCNCKEQFGTDGYTLWGGYYGQGYYPSRINAFMPGQTKETQLPAPLFRMLGSDPVYQYDFGMDPESGADVCQKVITLEPVYTEKGGGGDPAWVDWYLKENFNGECLSFGYAQAGQENSFGWPDMCCGLTYQFGRLAELQAEGKLTVEPLGDTGRWFKQQYPVTPASAITAHSAYDDPGKRSVWYSSRFYRANLYADASGLRLRDLHLFSENLPDPYEDTVCTGNEAAYETLPVADGNRHSGGGVVGGLVPLSGGRQLSAGELTFEDSGNGSARAECGELIAVFKEKSLELRGPEGFRLEARIAPGAQHVPEVISVSEKMLALRHQGVRYSIRLEKGRFADACTVLSEGGEIAAIFEA
jgi:hypothetical protein